ncbi:Oxidoreductase [Malassezia cuniculi]|uniref:Mitochondrial intermembrane space import and assembly protein 40 n=1 Tax=Malassezia cuniculi TaxID=948313 RepID=A0AAF0EYL1_9BASI|nr:Oxidoreductase [Malassezia cuniculi]
MFASLRQRIIPLARSRIAIGAGAAVAVACSVPAVHLESHKLSYADRLKPRPPVVIKVPEKQEADEEADEEAGEESTEATEESAAGAAEESTEAASEESTEAASEEFTEAASEESTEAASEEAAADGEEDPAEVAFDERTGEINWDCPCLGGMAHGPCGEEFKQAFSCFVFSEADPKGIDCVDKFKLMQDCFRRHPEVYADEIAADEAADEAAKAEVNAEDSD